VRAAGQPEGQDYPNWLTFNSDTMGTIARSIARDRFWDVLAILADALEDAGSDDAETLAHTAPRRVAWLHQEAGLCI
jgi:hypothetical protein